MAPEGAVAGITAFIATMGIDGEALVWLGARDLGPGQWEHTLPGVVRLSTPLPFRLRAINLYLLTGKSASAIVDCGYSRPDVREHWESLWRSVPGATPVERLIVTHFHPDHAGNAAWLCERWGLVPWMTQAEWLTANLALCDRHSADRAARSAFYARHGLSGTTLAQFAQYPGRYSDGVQLPASFRRLSDGQLIEAGDRDWRVIVGRGHSPEHASLYCERDGILIAGDQLLPLITTNISVWRDEPDADPLRDFFASLDRFNEQVDPDATVLPAHGPPFRGLRQRIAQIRAHHEERLERVLDRARLGPLTTADLLPVLFRPDLDAHQIGFAMGEALAHVNFLCGQGRLRSSADETHVRYAIA